MNEAFDRDKFIEHLGVIFKSRGLSQNKAAEIAGVSGATLSRRHLNLENSARLSRAFGINLDDYVRKDHS